MNRRLFEDLIVSARGGRERRGGLAFPASVGIHAVIVGGAVLLSVFGPGELMPEATARPVALPELPTVVRVEPRQAPVNPPPRSASHRAPRGVSLRGAARPEPNLTDTATTPTTDVLDPDDGCPEPCLVGASVGSGSDVGVGSPGDDGDGPGPPTIVRPGGDVAPPVKIRNVEPVYPEVARRARVEGIVIIECTIDPKGRIASARVLRGHPLLDGAALDAVQQWTYTPTRLNGLPVSVVMTVTVRFTIAH